MAHPIEDYGLIGDATTLARVSRSGSIDWLCPPRVDSDACFARLIGNDQHGYWTLRPAAEVRSVQQRYRPETLVLETEMLCAAGWSCVAKRCEKRRLRSSSYQRS